jgi:hypothetical protein
MPAEELPALLPNGANRGRFAMNWLRRELGAMLANEVDEAAPAGAANLRRQPAGGALPAARDAWRS